MAFQLKVSQGLAKGEHYSFEGEARLGRTADNDLVVKDGAASRSHARIFEKAGKFFIEDLGSANGTRLNDVEIKKTKELSNGDEVTIGDTVFVFEGVSDETLAPASTINDAEDAEGADAAKEDPFKTRKPSRAWLATVPAGASAGSEDVASGSNAEEGEPDNGADSDDGDSERVEVDEGESGAHEQAARMQVSSDSTVDEALVDEAVATRDVPLAHVKGRSRPSLGRPSRVELDRSSRARALREATSEGEAHDEEQSIVTAADKARMRRELKQSAAGRAQLMWMDLPKPARIIGGTVGFLLVIGTFGLAASVVFPRSGPTKVEPKSFPSDGALIEDSFGNGKVTFTNSDSKTFTFLVRAPTRIVGVLHYQAAHISLDEVVIDLNGQSLGSIPPDNIDVDSREIELVLPASMLKNNEENVLTFDNVRNPPSVEEWKVWNLWLEIIPVPDMSPEEAKRRAQGEIEKAAKSFEMREVGASNLFRAWKTYREAWLLLESTPNAPPELITRARTEMKDMRPELDKKCNAMIVKFKTIVNLRPNAVTEGRQVLEDIPNHFPTREHPCYNFSRALLRSIDGFDDFEAQGAQPVE